eukprot:8104379-Pyramimonas_sp.AAC.1
MVVAVVVSHRRTTANVIHRHRTPNLRCRSHRSYGPGCRFPLQAVGRPVGAATAATAALEW